MLKKLIVIVVCTLLIGTAILPVSGNVLMERTSTSTSFGNTLYVGGSGLGNYSTIQEAIDDAFDGDTVFVYDDSSPYYENLIVDKSIRLIGEDRLTTVIDGNQQEDVDIILIKAGGVTVQGFTIQNTSFDRSPDYNNGIEVWSNNNIIMDNIITDSAMGIQLGEEVKYQGHENNHSNFNIIEENSITDNHFAGVYIIFSDNNVIIRNTISDNAYHGVFLSYDSSQNQIGQNIITNHNQDGVFIHGGSNNTIVGNHIVGNELFGVSIGYSSFNYINHNNIYNNTINAVVDVDLWNFLIGRLKLKERYFDHSWNENYWGRLYLGPKPIKCALYLMIPTFLFGGILDLIFGIEPVFFLPIPRFDWRPAQEPYNIPSVQE